MAKVSDNARSGIDGAAYVGPAGTTAPTAYNSTLNAALHELGYIGEDGITETRDRSTSQLKAWQNGAVIRENVTEANYRYSFVCLETKLEVLELFYGVSVNTTTGALTVVPGATGGRKCFVFDILDTGGELFERTWIPSGEVTEVGEKTYTSDALVGYEVTITAYGHPSLDSGNGNAIKWYPDLIAA